MQIDIKDRIIIITGPSTTGKTTLTKVIKEIFPGKVAIICHDTIASKVSNRLSENVKNEEFFTLFVEEIDKTLKNSENDLIVFDVPGIEERYIDTLINIIEELNENSDDITIFKTNIPLEIHKKFMQSRYKNDIDVLLYYDDPKTYYEYMLGQRKIYEGLFGSLNADFFGYKQVIIDNPQDVTFNFDLPKKLKRK